MNGKQLTGRFAVLVSVHVYIPDPITSIEFAVTLGRPPYLEDIASQYKEKKVCNTLSSQVCLLCVTEIMAILC